MFVAVDAVFQDPTAMTKTKYAAAVFLLTCLPACATSFQGNANISVSKCTSRCSDIGGHMGAYIYMGQY